MEFLWRGASALSLELYKKLGEVFDFDGRRDLHDLSILSAWMNGGVQLKNLAVKPAALAVLGALNVRGYLDSLLIYSSGNLKAAGLHLSIDLSDRALEYFLGYPVYRDIEVSGRLTKDVGSALLQLLAHKLLANCFRANVHIEISGISIVVKLLGTDTTSSLGEQGASVKATGYSASAGPQQEPPETIEGATAASEKNGLSETLPSCAHLHIYAGMAIATFQNLKSGPVCKANITGVAVTGRAAAAKKLGAGIVRRASSGTTSAASTPGAGKGSLRPRSRRAVRAAASVAATGGGASGGEGASPGDTRADALSDDRLLVSSESMGSTAAHFAAMSSSSLVYTPTRPATGDSAPVKRDAWCLRIATIHSTVQSFLGTCPADKGGAASELESEDDTSDAAPSVAASHGASSDFTGGAPVAEADLLQSALPMEFAPSSGISVSTEAEGVSFTVETPDLLKSWAQDAGEAIRKCALEGSPGELATAEGKALGPPLAAAVPIERSSVPPAAPARIAMASVGSATAPISLVDDTGDGLFEGDLLRALYLVANRARADLRGDCGTAAALAVAALQEMGLIGAPKSRDFAESEGNGNAAAETEAPYSATTIEGPCPGSPFGSIAARSEQSRASRDHRHEGDSAELVELIAGICDSSGPDVRSEQPTEVGAPLQLVRQANLLVAVAHTTDFPLDHPLLGRWSLAARVASLSASLNVEVETARPGSSTPAGTTAEVVSSGKRTSGTKNGTKQSPSAAVALLPIVFTARCDSIDVSVDAASVLRLIDGPKSVACDQSSPEPTSGAGTAGPPHSSDLRELVPVLAFSARLVASATGAQSIAQIVHAPSSSASLLQTPGPTAVLWQALKEPYLGFPATSQAEAEDVGAGASESKGGEPDASYGGGVDDTTPETHAASIHANFESLGWLYPNSDGKADYYLQSGSLIAKIDVGAASIDLPQWVYDSIVPILRVAEDAAIPFAPLVTAMSGRVADEFYILHASSKGIPMAVRVAARFGTIRVHTPPQMARHRWYRVAAMFGPTLMDVATAMVPAKRIAGFVLGGQESSQRGDWEEGDPHQEHEMIDPASARDYKTLVSSAVHEEVRSLRAPQDADMLVLASAGIPSLPNSNGMVRAVATSLHFLRVAAVVEEESDLQPFGGAASSIEGGAASSFSGSGPDAGGDFADWNGPMSAEISDVKVSIGGLVGALTKSDPLDGEYAATGIFQRSCRQLASVPRYYTCFQVGDVKLDMTSSAIGVVIQTLDTTARAVMGMLHESRSVAAATTMVAAYMAFGNHEDGIRSSLALWRKYRHIYSWRVERLQLLLRPSRGAARTALASSDRISSVYSANARPMGSLVAADISNEVDFSRHNSIAVISVGSARARAAVAPASSSVEDCGILDATVGLKLLVSIVQGDKPRIAVDSEVHCGGLAMVRGTTSRRSFSDGLDINAVDIRRSREAPSISVSRNPTADMEPHRYDTILQPFGAYIKSRATRAAGRYSVDWTWHHAVRLPDVIVAASSADVDYILYYLLFAQQQVRYFRRSSGAVSDFVNRFRMLLRARLGLDQTTTSETSGRLIKALEASAFSLYSAFAQIGTPSDATVGRRRRASATACVEAHYTTKERWPGHTRKSVARSLHHLDLRSGHVRIAIHSDETAVRPALVRLWVSNGRVICRPSGAELRALVAVSYFNQRLECFEPIVEPFLLESKIDSEVVHGGSGAHKVNARRVRARISTEDPVRVVLSPALVSVGFKVAKEVGAMIDRTVKTSARISKGGQSLRAFDRLELRGMDPRRLSSTYAEVHVRNLGSQAVREFKLYNGGTVRNVQPGQSEPIKLKAAEYDGGSIASTGGQALDFGFDQKLSLSPTSMSHVVGDFSYLIDGVSSATVSRYRVDPTAVSRRIRCVPEAWGMASRSLYRLTVEFSADLIPRPNDLGRTDMLVQFPCIPRNQATQKLKDDVRYAFEGAAPHTMVEVERLVYSYKHRRNSALGYISGVVKRKDGSSVVDFVPSAWISNNLSYQVQVGFCSSLEANILRQIPSLAACWTGPKEIQTINPGYTFKLGFDAVVRPVVWMRALSPARARAAHSPADDSEEPTSVAPAFGGAAAEASIDPTAAESSVDVASYRDYDMAAGVGTTSTPWMCVFVDVAMHKNAGEIDRAATCLLSPNVVDPMDVLRAEMDNASRILNRCIDREPGVYQKNLHPHVRSAVADVRRCMGGFGGAIDLQKLAEMLRLPGRAQHTRAMHYVCASLPADGSSSAARNFLVSARPVLLDPRLTSGMGSLKAGSPMASVGLAGNSVELCLDPSVVILNELPRPVVLQTESIDRFAAAHESLRMALGNSRTGDAADRAEGASPASAQATTERTASVSGGSTGRTLSAVIGACGEYGVAGLIDYVRCLPPLEIHGNLQDPGGSSMSLEARDESNESGLTQSPVMYLGLSAKAASHVFRGLHVLSDSTTTLSLYGVILGTHPDQEADISTLLQETHAELFFSLAVAQELYRHLQTKLAEGDDVVGSDRRHSVFARVTEGAYALLRHVTIASSSKRGTEALVAAVELRKQVSSVLPVLLPMYLPSDCKLLDELYRPLPFKLSRRRRQVSAMSYFRPVLPTAWRGVAIATKLDLQSTTSIVLASEVNVYSIGSVPLVFSSLFKHPSAGSQGPMVAAGQDCRSTVRLHYYERRSAVLYRLFEPVGVAVGDGSVLPGVSCEGVEDAIVRFAPGTSDRMESRDGRSSGEAGSLRSRRRGWVVEYSWYSDQDFTYSAVSTIQPDSFVSADSQSFLYRYLHRRKTKRLRVFPLSTLAPNMLISLGNARNDTELTDYRRKMLGSKSLQQFHVIENPPRDTCFCIGIAHYLREDSAGKSSSADAINSSASPGDYLWYVRIGLAELVKGPLRVQLRQNSGSGAVSSGPRRRSRTQGITVCIALLPSELAAPIIAANDTVVAAGAPASPERLYSTQSWCRVQRPPSTSVIVVAPPLLLVNATRHQIVVRILRGCTGSRKLVPDAKVNAHQRLAVYEMPSQPEDDSSGLYGVVTVVDASSGQAITAPSCPIRLDDAVSLDVRLRLLPAASSSLSMLERFNGASIRLSTNCDYQLGTAVLTASTTVNLPAVAEVVRSAPPLALATHESVRDMPSDDLAGANAVSTPSEALQVEGTACTIVNYTQDWFLVAAHRYVPHKGLKGDRIAGVSPVKSIGVPVVVPPGGTIPFAWDATDYHSTSAVLLAPALRATEHDLLLDNDVKMLQVHPPDSRRVQLLYRSPVIDLTSGVPEAACLIEDEYVFLYQASSNADHSASNSALVRLYRVQASELAPSSESRVRVSSSGGGLYQRLAVWDTKPLEPGDMVRIIIDDPLSGAIYGLAAASSSIDDQADLDYSAEAAGGGGGKASSSDAYGSDHIDPSSRYKGPMVSDGSVACAASSGTFLPMECSWLPMSAGYMLPEVNGEKGKKLGHKTDDGPSQALVSLQLRYLESGVPPKQLTGLRRQLDDSGLGLWCPEREAWLAARPGGELCLQAALSGTPASEEFYSTRISIAVLSKPRSALSSARVGTVASADGAIDHSRSSGRMIRRQPLVRAFSRSAVAICIKHGGGSKILIQSSRRLVRGAKRKSERLGADGVVRRRSNSLGHGMESVRQFRESLDGLDRRRAPPRYPWLPPAIQIGFPWIDTTISGTSGGEELAVHALDVRLGLVGGVTSQDEVSSWSSIRLSMDVNHLQVDRSEPLESRREGFVVIRRDIKIFDQPPDPATGGRLPDVRMYLTMPMGEYGLTAAGERRISRAVVCVAPLEVMTKWTLLPVLRGLWLAAIGSVSRPETQTTEADIASLAGLHYRSRNGRLSPGELRLAKQRAMRGALAVYYGGLATDRGRDTLSTVVVENFELLPVCVVASFRGESSLYPNMTNSAVTIGGFKLEKTRRHLGDIGSLLASHVSQYMRRVMSTSAMSLDVIGNPHEVLYRISSGWDRSRKHFGAVAGEGKMMNAVAVSSATLYGAAYVSGSLASSTSGSVSRVLGSAGSMVSMLSFSRGYVDKTVSRAEASDASSGAEDFRLALQDMATGAWDGLVAVPTEISSGYSEDGIRGVFRGGVVGMLGVLVKPTVGLLSGGSRILSGLAKVIDEYLVPPLQARGIRLPAACCIVAVGSVQYAQKSNAARKGEPGAHTSSWTRNSTDKPTAKASGGASGTSYPASGAGADFIEAHHDVASSERDQSVSTATLRSRRVGWGPGRAIVPIRSDAALLRFVIRTMQNGAVGDESIKTVDPPVPAPRAMEFLKSETDWLAMLGCNLSKDGTAIVNSPVTLYNGEKYILHFAWPCLDLDAMLDGLPDASSGRSVVPLGRKNDRVLIRFLLFTTKRAVLATVELPAAEDLNPPRHRMVEMSEDANFNRILLSLQLLAGTSPDRWDGILYRATITFDWAVDIESVVEEGGSRPRGSGDAFQVAVNVADDLCNAEQEFLGFDDVGRRVSGGSIKEFFDDFVRRIDVESGNSGCDSPPPARSSTVESLMLQAAAGGGGGGTESRRSQPPFRDQVPDAHSLEKGKVKVNIELQLRKVAILTARGGHIIRSIEGDTGCRITFHAGARAPAHGTRRVEVAGPDRRSVDTAVRRLQAATGLEPPVLPGLTDAVHPPLDHSTSSKSMIRASSEAVSGRPSRSSRGASASMGMSVAGPYIMRLFSASSGFGPAVVSVASDTRQPQHSTDRSEAAEEPNAPTPHPVLHPWTIAYLSLAYEAKFRGWCEYSDRLAAAMEAQQPAFTAVSAEETAAGMLPAAYTAEIRYYLRKKPWLRLLRESGINTKQLAAADVSVGEDVKIAGRPRGGVMKLLAFEAWAAADLSESVECLYSLHSDRHPAVNLLLMRRSFDAAVTACTKSYEARNILETRERVAAGRQYVNMFQEEGDRQNLMVFLLLLARPRGLVDCVFMARAVVARESVGQELEEIDGHSERGGPSPQRIRFLNYMATVRNVLGTVLMLLRSSRGE